MGHLVINKAVQIVFGVKHVMFQIDDQGLPLYWGTLGDTLQYTPGVTPIGSVVSVPPLFYGTARQLQVWFSFYTQ